MHQSSGCSLIIKLLLVLYLLISLPVNASAADSRVLIAAVTQTGHWSAADDAGDDGDGDDDDGEFVTDQIVVKLDLPNGADIDAINAAYGTMTFKTLLNSGGIYLLQTPPNTDVEQLADQMEDDLRLLYAEPNFYGELPEGGSRGKWAWGGPDPAQVGTQYAAAMLRLSDAHALSRGEQVIVAVLDSGVQLDHPALAARLTPARYDFVDDDAVPDEDFANLDTNGDGFVDESAGHGTHVAGIVSMVAPDAQIMPLRVLDASGRGNVFLIAEAVLYAVENGAQIVNMSLGTTGESELLADVIDEAFTMHNIVVVAAAGNLNRTDPMFPAAEDAVLAVTAVDAGKKRPDFANYGSWVDIAAPGTEIYSAFPISSYAYWSGTSMATPFIAGQAALLYSLNPSLTALDMHRCILDTAQPLAPDLGAGLTDLVASLTIADTGCAEPDDDDDDDDVPNQNEDLNGNGTPQDDDTDNDGLLNYLDPDDDNDTVSTTDEHSTGNNNPQDDDTDNDGIANYLDADDDNDAVLTVNETPNNSSPQAEDSDGDGVPNYLDSDDDNDTVFTVNEDPNGNHNRQDDDTDGDGAPNYLDSDDDNDTLFTVDEDANGNKNPQDDDTDGDGTPDYLDLDEDGAPNLDLPPAILYLPLVQRTDLIPVLPRETED